MKNNYKQLAALVFLGIMSTLLGVLAVCVGSSNVDVCGALMIEAILVWIVLLFVNFEPKEN